MKKFFALAVMFAVTASFVGCGKPVEKKPEPVKEVTEEKKEGEVMEEKKEETKEEPAPAPVEEKKE